MADDWSSREYELQLLTFDRPLLKWAIRDLLNDRLKALTDQAEQDLTSTDRVSLTPAQLDTVRTRLKRISEYFSEGAKEPLGRIEQAIDDCLSIPDNVLLPLDEGCGSQPVQQKRQLEQEVEQLRSRALAAAAGSRLLERELAIVRSDRVKLTTTAANNVAMAINNISISDTSSAASLLQTYLSLDLNTDSDCIPRLQGEAFTTHNSSPRL